MADYVTGQPPHPTCKETTSHAELAAGMRSYICGQDCPRPAGPDPARDARVDAYRDRERRRAARALDRYMEVIFEATEPSRVSKSTVDALTVMTASERFVEQVGDYVLARLGELGGGRCLNSPEHPCPEVRPHFLGDLDPTERD